MTVLCLKIKSAKGSDYNAVCFFNINVILYVQMMIKHIFLVFSGSGRHGKSWKRKTFEGERETEHK